MLSWLYSLFQLALSITFGKEALRAFWLSMAPKFIGAHLYLHPTMKRTTHTMIDQARTFGSTFGTTASNDSADAKSTRPEAQVYANIGYECDSDDGKYSFVSIGGLAIDTLEPKAVNSRDPRHAAFQQAGIDLVALVQGIDLAPGEAKVYGARGSLQIQLRRRDNAVAAPVMAPGTNPFSAKLAL